MRPRGRRTAHHAGVSTRAGSSATGMAIDGWSIDFSIDPAIPRVDFQDFRFKIRFGETNAVSQNFPHGLGGKREAFDMFLEFVDIV